MIRQLSETVVLPIAGLVLTFVATYELIQLIVEKNNLHDVDTWIFFKWIFKTFMAVMILSNTFNIVMAVFDVAQHVIQNAGGLIQGSTDVTADMMNNLEATLQGMDIVKLEQDLSREDIEVLIKYASMNKDVERIAIRA